MPTNRQTVPGSWDAAGRITAAEDTAVYITETAGRAMYWAVTADDTAPTFQENFGHRLDARDQIGITLKTGERLWLARNGIAGDCSLTTGAV
ncbi:MAG: hypothetical protein KI788_06325 [Mameliella sp.]|nr:hypothetical protein [Mameliella sp.]